MKPPSVPSSSKLPENNIEACEQAAVLARAARRAVSRVRDAAITAQMPPALDVILMGVSSDLDGIVSEYEAVTASRREA